LFALRDVQTLFPNEKAKTVKNDLVRWVSKGYFSRLRRDLYERREEGSGMKIPDLYVGNRMYEPSYVSLDTALSLYSIIPDVAAAVTSVTTRPTREFRNDYGVFIYKSCKEEAFTGYRLTNYEGFKILIADEEKAFVDFIYYRLRSGRSLDWSEERFNKQIMAKASWSKIIRYAGLLNDKIVKLAKESREYFRC
jgi:predicted transcriptional regulator of viral defense system